jgi:hypothetical protein
MKRITLVCAAMLAAGTASAADCKRFTDLIGPVSRNFEGVAITKMTQTWNIMAQPVLAARARRTAIAPPRIACG